MHTLIVVSAFVPIGVSFPKAGDLREIERTNDDSEWLVEVQRIDNLEWKYENGQVTGASCDMEVKILEETRPSSKGKLRLV